MAACRGLRMQARKKGGKEEDESSGEEAQQHEDTLEQRYCV